MLHTGRPAGVLAAPAAGKICSFAIHLIHACAGTTRADLDSHLLDHSLAVQRGCTLAPIFASMNPFWDA